MSSAGGQPSITEKFVRALREGDPDGRSRTELDPMIMRHDGRVYREVMTRGYDGRTSWTWRKSTQVDEHPLITMKSAAVSGGRAVYHREVSYGWTATLPGFYDDRGARFSDVLDSPEVPFGLHHEDGDPCVVLTCVSRDLKGTHEWFLRPDWSYCMQRYVHRQADGLVRREIEVLEASRLHDDFWYPNRFRIVDSDSSGQVTTTSEGDVIESSLLTSVSAEVFEPRFPHGTVVSDEVTGMSVTVAAPDVELGARIEDQARVLDELVLYQHAGGVLARWWLIILGGVVILVGMFVLKNGSARLRPADRTGRRRWRPRPARRGTALMCAVSLVGIGGASAQAPTPWMMRELAGQSADNSLLNATALVVAFHSHELILSDLAQELGLGPSRVELPTLHAAATVLADSGLEVSAVKSTTLSRLVDGLREVPRSLAIVQLAAGTSWHRYLVVGPSAKGVVIADAAAGMAAHALTDPVAERVGEAFTGTALVVRPGEPGVDAWDVCAEQSWTLLVGNALPGPAVRRIPVANHGSDGLRLADAESTCGCFVDAVMVPAVVAPGQAGSITVRIDGARFGPGDSGQQVRLGFESGSVRLTRQLLLSVSAIRANRSITPCAVPSLIEAVADSSSGRSAGEVQVLVPDGGLVVGWKARAGVAVVLSGVNAFEQAVACVYRVEWEGRRGWVEFSVRDRLGVIKPVRCVLRGTGTGQVARAKPN
ncbi:MAG: hypothetical protein AB7O97_13940 [Planctomycetota bacterium]